MLTRVDVAVTQLYSSNWQIPIQMCNNVLTIIAFKVQTSDENCFKSVSEHSIKRQCQNITCINILTVVINILQVII
jgi:hypothetical protein